MCLEGFELLQQGAEARLYKGTYLGRPAIAKERFPKKYRHPDLDSIITKERMNAESRAVVRCKSVGVKTPMLYLVDYELRTIFLEYFEDSVTVKYYIENYSDETSLNELSLRIGKLVGKIHSVDVIHGDLTSSNILLVKIDKTCGWEIENLELVLIDFGLAHIESSAEDKGVDLYVLERALISTCGEARNIFKKLLDGYKAENRNYKTIFSKYEEVKARGRKRTMVG